MDIVVGMLLLCAVKIELPTSGHIFLKSIETRVHHITPKQDALIEYNFNKNKNIRFNGIGGSQYDIVAIVDLKAKTYMNCEKIGNEQKIKK